MLFGFIWVLIRLIRVLLWEVIPFFIRKSIHYAVHRTGGLLSMVGVGL